MHTVAIPQRKPVLIDAIARTGVHDAAAIVGFVFLTAAAAQVSIPLGFTPVPLTGQTMAVLLCGGVLGARRGAVSQALYVALGAMGAPFYAEGLGGWSVATGATGGYLVGFVIAAWAVGALMERGHGISPGAAVPAFITGSAIIYITGAVWLAHRLDVPVAAAPGEPSAINYGVAPFLVGDAIKAVIAGLLVPAASRLVDAPRNADF